jgi:hypothetical protein
MQRRFDLMPRPSPDIAIRVDMMRGMAKIAAARGQVFVYVRIPEPLWPQERGKKYEDPLAAALADAGLGKVTGGGQQLDGGSIEYCGVDVILNNRAQGLALLKDVLRRLGAPAGTMIEEFLPEFQEHPLGRADAS